MKNDDAKYCIRRALEELLAARNATCAVARERHEELAGMYRFRAAMLTTSPDMWLEKRPAKSQVDAQ